MTDTTPDQFPAPQAGEASLTRYRLVDLIERTVTVAAGTPHAYQAPGGSCSECGQELRWCYVIQHTDTGATREIGETCAEKVGLTAAQVKAFYAAKFAQQRAAAADARAEARRRKRLQLETIETHWYGPHGAQGRYLSGCRCEPCMAAAPHATAHRFWAGCRCQVCVDHMLAQPDIQVWPRRYLIRIEGDQLGLVDARKVDTQYGTSWVVDRPDGGTDWIRPGAARRSTATKKGYVEVEVPTLCQQRNGREGRYWASVHPLETPTHDIWGQPLPDLAEG